MSVLVVDRSSFDIGTAREITDQGYLKVPGRVARSGIQTYTAGELGLTDRNANERVKVYRPDEEVFADASLDSYLHADVTNDHPSDMVTADSFKDVAVGHVASRPYRDGDFVVVDLLIKDKGAIKAVQDGKAALSAGYEAEYSREPGVTTDGEDYEFVQRGIRINHIALVDKARAGPSARLFDTDGDNPMGKTVTLDKSSGNTVEVADESTAKLIQQTIDGLHEKVSAEAQRADDAASKRDELQAAHDKAVEDRDAYKAKASDEAIAERIKAVTDTREQARAMVGDDAFTTDSVDPMQIRREALSRIRPSMDWADKSDAYVAAAWDMEVNSTDEDRARRSHDGLGADLQHLQTQDGKPEAGTAAYQQFLHPGSKH